MLYAPRPKGPDALEHKWQWRNDWAAIPKVLLAVPPGSVRPCLYVQKSRLGTRDSNVNKLWRRYGYCSGNKQWPKQWFQISPGAILTVSPPILIAHAGIEPSSLGDLAGMRLCQSGSQRKLGSGRALCLWWPPQLTSLCLMLWSQVDWE